MKKQLPSCSLLKVGIKGFVCLGGVNFFAVGEDRALCQDCELLSMEGLGALLSCEHIDVYTHLTYENQHPIVRPIFDCDLPADAPAEQRCAACPAAVSSTQEQETAV